MVDDRRPYLSVVATARNDDHGGNLLRRMQVFVNALIAQAGRHGVPLELILVEWNPPPDRPRLAEVLEWPADFGPCSVRIIEVPPSIHAGYKHADALPLYQMIAKNVGIRRARGHFVLATNIDIVFSDELFQFFSERGLKQGTMYRIDRHDVTENVPEGASTDELLTYCKSHLLRINAWEGTFSLTPDGLRCPFPEDIVAPDSGIFLGRGWFPVERYAGRLFRWVGNDAEVVVRPANRAAQTLTFDLEPGPGVGYGPFFLQILEPSRNTTEEVRIDGRSLLRVRLPFCTGQTGSFRCRVLGDGLNAPHDRSGYNFRVLRCAWEPYSGKRVAAGEDVGGTSVQAVAPRTWARVADSGLSVWRFLTRGVRFSLQLCRARDPIRMGMPIPPRLSERLQVRVEESGISLTIDPIALRRRLTAWLPFARDKGKRRWEAGHGGALPLSGSGRYLQESRGREALGQTQDVAVAGAERLHTNGCGDFTLLARQHWLDLRGYPEFDLFSMNIDSVFCHAAHYGGAREQVLEEPMRIYHIEHQTGSGWTPEGQAKLFERIAAKGLSWIDSREVIEWARQMHRLEAPMIFNRENWGLGDVDLSETELPSAAGVSNLG